MGKKRPVYENKVKPFMNPNPYDNTIYILIYYLTV